MNELKSAKLSPGDGHSQEQTPLSNVLDTSTQCHHRGTSLPLNQSSQPSISSSSFSGSESRLLSFSSRDAATASQSSADGEFAEVDHNCSFAVNDFPSTAGSCERQDNIWRIPGNMPNGGTALKIAGEELFVSDGVDDLEPEFSNELIIAKASYECEEFPVTSGELDLSRFKKLRVLGKGGSGTVHLVALAGTYRIYAMKEVMKQAMLRQHKTLRVLTELEILATVHHPFIVTMYASFETTARFCFIMEYCSGGAFFKVLLSQPMKRLNEDAARFYAAEVLLALEYLHHLGFFYRDLKPENILMHGSGHIVLTDFDLSKQAQPVSPITIHHHLGMRGRVSKLLGRSSSSTRLAELDIVDSEPVLLHETNSFVGTIEYLAPEVVDGSNQTPAVDWWGFGVLIFEMMTGTTPFRAPTFSEILTNIQTSEKITWPRDVIVSTSGKRLVKRLLRRHVDKRLGAVHGASDIKADKWFAGVNFAMIRNETPPIIPTVPQGSSNYLIDPRDPHVPKSAPDQYLLSPTENSALTSDEDCRKQQRDSL